MEAEFRRWYETVELAVDPAVAGSRWAAVQGLAQSATIEELDALIRAAFRSDQTTAATASVRAKLADKGGAMQGEEFVLLAAATLVVVLRYDLPAAARVATMIVTAHFNGLREIRQPMDLVGVGKTARLELAHTARQRPPLQMEPMPSLEVDTSAAEASEDSNESIRLLADAFAAVIQLVADRQTEFEQRAARYISVQDEELDMLWWLQGGRTRSGQLFTEIPRDQRPFVFARDLAEATFAMPGAPAVESLLARAGVEDGEPLSIAAAIQALPIEWLKTALPEADKSKVSPVTTPLHEGIKRRLEVRGEDTWIAGWAGVCDIDKAARLTSLQLANLCYCEQLLIRR